MKVKPPNVILLTIDCLRFDHLGCYGYSRDTSPNIDNLASRGALFLEAISNGGSTPFAFPSILASSLPITSSSELAAPLRGKTTIAELLRQNGYYTATIHDNPYLVRPYGYHKGFDIYAEGPTGFSPRKARSWIGDWLGVHPNSLASKFYTKLRSVLRPILEHAIGRDIITGAEITNKVLSWPIADEERFFLWLHYMDVHVPYMPPPKYVRQFCSRPVGYSEIVTLSRRMWSELNEISPSEVETIISLYDAAIKYVDDAIGLLLNRLGSLLENTIVIVTGDHGDEFGEHRKFNHRTLYDGILRIPLIVTGPSIKAGTVVKEQVSHIDLAPTIADFAGVESPPGFYGRSLLPLINGAKSPAAGIISTGFGIKWGETLDWVFPTTKFEQLSLAYRIPRWKYIRTEHLDDNDAVLAEEVYDLRNDPDETRNLHGLDVEEAKRFELEAKNKLLQFKQLKSEEKTAYEKQRIKAKLKKLGKS